MSFFQQHKKGITATLVFHIALLILLLTLGLSFETPPPEEGILINFGTSETGSGLVEPSLGNPVHNQEQNTPQEQTQVPVQTQPQPKDNNPQGEKIMNQNFEESAAIDQKSNQKLKEEKQIQDEQDKVIKKLEQERIAKEEKERKEKIEQERIAKETEERLVREKQQKQLMDNMAQNAFAGRNPNQNASQSEGNTVGNGNQGNPDGDPNSQNREGRNGNGNSPSFTLEGRLAQSLPIPDYSVQKEGKVVVEIYVDRNGVVVDAIPGKKGSNTTDGKLFEAARKAALKARFSPSPNAPDRQKGTITYIFILN